MLDIEAIKEATSVAIFSKAEKLLGNKKVAVKARDAKRIMASVSGQLVYQVKLEIEGESIARAQCSCPAFAYQSLCKHCIATALAYNQTDEQISAIEDDEQKLRRFLLGQAPEKLVEQLINFALDDADKYKYLLFQMESANKTYTAKELGKLLTKALPMREVWQSDKVYSYFQNAENVLKVYFEQAEKLAATEYFLLLDKVAARLDKVLERVDDSAGYRFSLVARLEEQSQAAFARLDWSDKKKAQWVVDNILVSYDYNTTATADYLTSDGLKEAFLQCCQTEVDSIELPADVYERERDWRLHRLIQPLLEQAISREDVHLQAKLLAKKANSVNDLIDISLLYLDNEDEYSAQDWLIKAQKLPATDSERSAVQALQVKIELAFGNVQNAWQAAWRRFTEQPCYSAFLQLEQTSTLTGTVDSEYLTKVEECLLALSDRQTQKFAGFDQHDVLEFYLHQNSLEQAIEWAELHPVNYNLLAKIALSLIGFSPEQAVVFYQRSMSDCLKIGGNSRYAEAVSYLTKFEERWLEKAQDEKLLKKLLNDLALRFKAKRNFVKLMDNKFAKYLD